MTDISKEAKHIILLVDFIDERVNQMDGRSLYEINNSIQRLRTHILAIQARVSELECEHSADFDMGRVQGLDEAAELARNFTTANHVAQDIKDKTFPEQSPVRDAIARAIEALKEQTND